jgi:hypothetical protein
MKEMMASLKAIGEQLNDKPVMAREGASSSRNWRGRPSSPESTRLRQSQEYHFSVSIAASIDWGFCTHACCPASIS